MANTTADKLAKLAETKSSIKQAIIDKGVDVSDTDTFASYAGKIGQISGGGIPNYIAPKNNVNGVYKPDNTATSFSLNGATDVGAYALYLAFYNCTNLTSVDLSSLTTISGGNAMNQCFSGCTGLTSVSFPALTTISGGRGMSECFYNCSNLTSVDLPSLTTVSGGYAMSYCFQNCANLTELRFPALQSFGTSATTVNQLNNMLSGVTGCTLRFPSNMQAEVERRQGYPNFGGTDTVVLFDLPPTNA